VLWEFLSATKTLQRFLPLSPTSAEEPQWHTHHCHSLPLSQLYLLPAVMRHIKCHSLQICYLVLGCQQVRVQLPDLLLPQHPCTHHIYMGNITDINLYLSQIATLSVHLSNIHNHIRQVFGLPNNKCYINMGTELARHLCIIWVQLCLHLHLYLKMDISHKETSHLPCSNKGSNFFKTNFINKCKCGLPRVSRNLRKWKMNKLKKPFQRVLPRLLKLDRP
jgi:hypothetical protein